MQADWLNNSGYEFVSLQEAPLDPAFDAGDTCVGTDGIAGS